MSECHGCGDRRLLLRRPPRSLRGAARRVAVAVARARLAERGPRVVDTRRQIGLGVRRPGDRTQRDVEQSSAVAKQLERDRPRRHRGRRLPRRQAGAAPGGPGPRRPPGVGDLRAARARLPHRRPRAPGAPATPRGTTGRSRSSTPSRRTGCACWRSCPGTRPRLRRPSSSGARASDIAARSSTCSTSTSAIRSWDRLWAAAAETGLPISFHIKGGPGRGSATRWASGSRRPSPRSCRCSSTKPLATMVFCGALERHPGCTLVLAESGIGWLPYFLARMDLEWEALNDKLVRRRSARGRASCSAAR